MKSETKNLVRVLISILYIVWGILSPLKVIGAILALNLAAIVSGVVGVLMLLAGIFGLIGVKKANCRLFGIIIFVAAVVSIVLSLPVINLMSIISAILAWLFIAAVK